MKQLMINVIHVVMFNQNKHPSFKYNHNPEAKFELSNFTEWRSHSTLRVKCLICNNDSIEYASYEITLSWDDDSHSEYLGDVCESCICILKKEHAPPPIPIPTHDRHLIKMIPSMVHISNHELVKEIWCDISWYIDIFVIQSGQKRRVHTIWGLCFDCHKKEFNLYPPTLEFPYGYGYGIDTSFQMNSSNEPHIKNDEPVTRLCFESKFEYNKKNYDSYTSIRWRKDAKQIIYTLDDGFKLKVKLIF
jgi:hypothetical protein